MAAHSREVALYYPYMLPPVPWVKQALLLYDEVASIVHPDLLAPELASGRTTSRSIRPDHAWLRREGYWVPTMVTDLFGDDRNYIRDISTTLDFFGTDPQYWFDGQQFPAPERLTSLYLGKLSPGVERALLERQLAKLGRHGGHLVVHEEIAAIVLSVTAKYLAAANRDPSVRMVAGTDDRTRNTQAFGSLPGAADHHTSLTILLRGLCPTPSASVSFEDIVDFRERHQQELLRFRREIDRMIQEVRDAHDPVEAVHVSRREIELALLDVRSAAASRGLKLLGTAMTVTVVAAGRVLLPVGAFELAFQGFGVPAAVALGAFASSRPRPRNASPYAYLVEAKELVH